MGGSLHFTGVGGGGGGRKQATFKLNGDALTVGLQPVALVNHAVT